MTTASQKLQATVTSRETDAPAPVRVVIVAPSLDILGGQAIQASRLLRRFGEERSLVVDFLPVNPRLPGPLRALQNVKYVRTVCTSIMYVGLLLFRLRRYDIIHVFSASYLSFLLAPAPAILVAWLYRLPVVLNYRSGEAEDHLARWRRTALPIIKLARYVVVPSGYLVDVFSRFGVSAQAISNFVEPTEFCFRARETLTPVFFSNRNLEPLYNVGCIIDAFKLIQAEYSDAKLVIAGDGSERGRLEARVCELALRNVTFLGRVAATRMADIYDQADIYLNSPNIDNMPTSVIEAFSCGLPVVTSNAGGIPYIVQHEQTGLIFEKGDHVALASQALRLLNSPTLAQTLISNARAACDQYRWPTICKSWVELYHDLGEKTKVEHG